MKAERTHLASWRWDVFAGVDFCDVSFQVKTEDRPKFIEWLQQVTREKFGDQG